MSTSTPRAPLTNVLSQAKSPYLLQHAKNPVAWQEWKPETIKRAQEEQLPIFLSVGYSACHWCHVLAHESFEDESVAEIMNKYFVNIKVDREERPDVDKVYMTYLQATQGGGGWPLSVFLTPDLTPVFAGTYFPRQRFKSLLVKIADLWEEDPDRLLASGKRVMEQLQEQEEQEESSTTSLATIASTSPPKLFAHLLKRYSPRYGGFSHRGPKFPSPSQTTTFLSRYAVYNDDEDEAAKAAEMGMRQIRALWEGGIRDWVGNGLARYSVDEKWRVPHFEKMLYDQAQIASTALDFATLPNLPTTESRTICLDLAADILQYTARDLRSPSGGFFSAEDADSAESFEDLHRTTEGAFYVWTKEEFDQVLGEDATVAGDFFGIRADGNVDPEHDVQGELTGKNTLHLAKTVQAVSTAHHITPAEVENILQRSTKKLKEHRDKTRPRPHLDDKIVASWNGLMISALAQASQVLPETLYPIASQAIALAEETVAFIKKDMYDDATGILSRTWREGKGPTGQADDYAFLAKGLLDLYQATGTESHLVFALRLQDKLDELFWDENGGGYYASAPDEHILMRMKDSQDGAEPSAQAVTLSNLQRLALIASSRYEEFSSKADRTFKANGEMLLAAPQAFGASLAALMDMEAGYREYVIIGSASDPFVKGALSALYATYSPNKVVIRIDPAVFPTGLPVVNPTVTELLENMGSAEKPSLRVCENFACQLPVYTLEEAKQVIMNA